MRKSFFLPVLAAVCLSAASAFAQELRSEVNVQGMATFTRSTNDFLSPYSATRSGGFLAGYRYHLTPWFAVQGYYGYTRNTQNFFDPFTLGAGVQT
ncbi:MAG TPA: outer membrane beta-barrel protein, partial [Candidatus Limnocylindrales bacterium]|nr:outer membrane beta-barrel protein [Candidatus Limnocylindrales bacterium]